MLAKTIDTIIFDWGNTLMQVNPAYSGKMKDWPVIKAIPGSKKTLANLSARYKIGLATNASDSTVRDITEVLERVGLLNDINEIFISRDMQTTKLNPEFYVKVCQQMKTRPQCCLMVGDDYHNDILSANSAGLYTAWLNPSFLLAPAQLPLHDIEISVMSDLEKALLIDLLPSYQKCLSWYLQLGASNSLLAHVNMVASSAYQIAGWFAQKGIPLSPLLAHRGGLLHDLAKLSEKPGENHAVTAARLLNQYGQPALAQIALHHLIGNLGDSTESPDTWEEKIVNYCDKLTEGNQLVSLDQRLEALQSRYPRFAEKIRINTPFVKELENEILSVLGISNDELLTNLKTALYEPT